MKLKIIISFISIAIIVAIISGVFIGGYLYSREKILQGCYIGKIYVGGLTREEALSILITTKADDVISSPFALVYDDGKKITRYEFMPSQAGAELLAQESVDDAVFISHKKNYLQQVYFKFRKRKIIIQPRFRIVDEGELSQLIVQVSQHVNTSPVSARFISISFKGKDGKRHYSAVIKSEKIGKTVLAEETARELKDALEKGKSQCALAIKITDPPVTNKMLEQIPNPSVIGSYTTYYGTHDSPNRIHNIYLASSFVDNSFIASGEVFSLLKPVGGFTKDRGFKEAYVIMGTELVPQYGGGTCQIATTLYNAVMMADLDVLFRVNHGMYFSIYPLGRDATVYPPYPDFKFRNNTGHPIVINAKPFKKGLTFRIFGTPTGKKVYFTFPRMTYLYTTTATLDAETGETVTEKVRTSAFRTIVIRTVKKNEEIIKTEQIRSSYKLHGDKQRVKIRRREPR